MKIAKFFEIAKEKGLEEAQIQITRSKSTTLEYNDGEIESVNVADSQSIIASGIYDGKYASVSADRVDDKDLGWLVDKILLGASIVEEKAETRLFEGSPKYRKKNVYSKAVEALDVAELGQELLPRLEKLTREKEPRTFRFQSQLEKVESTRSLYNSFGLKLVNKTNALAMVAIAYARDGEEVRNAYDVVFDSDLSKFDVDALSSYIAEEIKSQFGGEPSHSGKYPVVFRNDVFADFADVVVGAASSEQVQKNSSFFVGKLGEKVASKKLTISEKPLAKTVHFTYFDSEGVARFDKDIVKNGVLKTYLYNRETAKKDGVESTGNAAMAGGKIGIGYASLYVKPGRKSFDEMIAPIKEGVFVTSVQGTGTGINDISGNFSLQASGRMIRDGKLAEPVTLITVSGNIIKMLLDIKEIDSNLKLTSGGISSPDVYVKSLAIGGK